MTGPDLKPCPFCGGHNIRAFRHVPMQPDPCAMCRDCYASAVSVAAWNARISPAIQPDADRLLALTAAAYEAAANLLERHRDYGMVGPDGDHLASEAEVLAHGHSLHYALCEVSALTPADAIAARESRDSQMRAEGRVAGLREAAEQCAKPGTEYERKVAQMKEDFPNGI